MQQTLLHHEEEETPVCACCTSKRLKYSSCFVTLIGLGLLLVAIFIPSFIQGKLDDGIQDYVSLAPDAQQKQSEGFRTWSNWADEDALPIYQSVYIYNITNPHEILASPTTKPNVTQHGPYVYREYKIKFDFVYGEDYDNRQTLQFKEWIYWTFERDQTDMSLNPDVDMYTTFNFPFQAVTNAMKTAGQLDSLWPIIDGICGKAYPTDFEKLFSQQITVSQLLFGYQDCISNFIPADGIAPKGFFPGLLGWNVPQSNTTNTTTVGSLITPDTIYTGDDDGDYMRQYATWKDEQYLTVVLLPPPTLVEVPIWGSAAANRVYGTDGSQFKRNVKDNSTVNAWVDDIMRHVPLLNVDGLHVNDLHGIDLVRYTLDPKILKNDTQLPENADYYMYHHNGLLNISLSKQGLPIFMSKPHFLDADQELVDDIIGMSPDRETHDTNLDVEPLTGATMRANKRLQVNLHTEPVTIGGLVPQNWYMNVGDHYIPSVWIDENGEISADKASDFKETVYGAQDAIKYIHLLGTIIGSVLLAVATSMYFSAVSRSATEQRTAIAGGAGVGINDRY